MATQFRPRSKRRKMFRGTPPSISDALKSQWLDTRLHMDAHKGLRRNTPGGRVAFNVQARRFAEGETAKARSRIWFLTAGGVVNTPYEELELGQMLFGDQGSTRQPTTTIQLYIVGDNGQLRPMHLRAGAVAAIEAL